MDLNGPITDGMILKAQSKLYKLDGILTVVDAKHIVEHLKEEKPEGVENESVEQVCRVFQGLPTGADCASSRPGTKFQIWNFGPG